MWKSKWEGGIKLINVQAKTDAYKIKWLLDLYTNPRLHLNLNIFYRLLGQQVGHVPQQTIFFLDTKFMKNKLKSHSKFYSSSLLAFSQLDFRKAVPDLHQEHIFYNPLFSKADGNTFDFRKMLAKDDIFTYGQPFTQKISRGYWVIDITNRQSKCSMKYTSSLICRRLPNS